MFELRRGWSLESSVSNHNTLEIEMDNDEPSPEVTVETIWCKAVQNIVEDNITTTLRNTEEVQNIVMNLHWKSHHEHRDGSKL